MVAELKEYQLSVDYCAFMVAILLARHIADRSNTDVQWSALEVSEKLNILPLAESANFHVDSNALQHGFSLFQQILNKRGTLLIPVGGELEPVNDFFDLKAAGRTLKIKFLRYNYPPSEETPPELLERILRIRNDLLRKSNYPESLHSSPSSVFSDLFLPMIIGIRAPVLIEEEVTKEIKIPKITRKSPSKLQKRRLRHNSLIVLKSVEDCVGEKNTEFYLKSALSESSNKKRKFAENTEISDSEDLAMGYEEMAAQEDVKEDDRVLEAITKLPQKYIIYGDEDRNNVIELFEAVRIVYIERDHIKANRLAAATTATILSDIKHYSNIQARTILRWYGNKGKECLKPGPKIDHIFESEVWSNLMLCIFEKNRTEVRNC